MKKILLRSLAALIFFFLGCGELLWQPDSVQPTLKIVKEKEQSKTTYNCNFSTESLTTNLNKIFWHSLSWNIDDNHPSQFIELESQTVMEGSTSWRSLRTKSSILGTTNDRQEAVCMHLENEFNGFNNALYRKHHYIEKYKISKLKNATNNLLIDEYAEVKPEGSYFIIEYADPTRSPLEPIKIKAIPITSACRESTRVNSYEGKSSSARYKFRHSETCDFFAIEHEYILLNGEKILLNLTGSIEPSHISERLILKIKQVGFREVD